MRAARRESSLDWYQLVPEGSPGRVWLDERAETGWLSSVLTEIESFRALARYAPEAASRLPPC